MTISMYVASVPVYARMLANLSNLLAKAADTIAARKFNPDALLQARLYPDMFNLTRQVQVACDAAKFGSARLAGVEAPKHEDNETSILQLQDRIAATIGFIQGIPREKFDGAEQREITIPMRDRALTMQGMPYLLHFALPNFYFHLTTAYALLRHNGVEVGKRDFLGPVA
jgi:uncharacterized protein